MKLVGVTRTLRRGPARVFEGEEAFFAGVTARQIRRRRRRRHSLRRPGRRTRHARDARGSPPPSRAAASAIMSPSSPTGASRARPTASWSATSRPRRARGGPLAAIEDGDRIVIDVDAQELSVEIAADELAARLAAWTPRSAAVRERRARQVRRARVVGVRGRRHAAEVALPRRSLRSYASDADEQASCRTARAGGSALVLLPPRRRHTRRTRPRSRSPARCSRSSAARATGSRTARRRTSPTTRTTTSGSAPSRCRPASYEYKAAAERRLGRELRPPRAAERRRTSRSTSPPPASVKFYYDHKSHWATDNRAR